MWVGEAAEGNPRLEKGSYFLGQPPARYAPILLCYGSHADAHAPEMLRA